MSEWGNTETLFDIRNHLAAIQRALWGGMFLRVLKPDGSISFINLAQAAEIAILSEQECQIKFVDGGVVSVETKSGVDEVLYLIGAKTRPPVSRGPLQQDQTK